MKRIVLITLVASVAFLIALGVQRTRQRAPDQVGVADLRRKLSESEMEASRRQALADREQSRLQEQNLRLAEKARELSARQVVSRESTSSALGGEDEKSRFAAVHKDPEMKEAMRRQAREAVQKGVKQLMTGNLLQQLGLDDTQTAALKELLTRKGTLGFEFMMPLMSGDLDGAALSEAGKQTKGAMIEVEAEMKGLLGEEGYRKFEAYEKAQPDRDQLRRFATLQDEAGEPVTGAQREQLLAAMTEERNQFRFTVDFSDTSKIDYEHFQDFYSEEKLNRYFEELDQLNARLVARAGTILTREQAGRFQELLRDQMLKGKYVVKTTNALIGKRAAR